MDRQRMARCLAQKAAYRASGLKGDAWAEANGVPLKALSSWCGHARRWQGRLDGGLHRRSRRRSLASSPRVCQRTSPPPCASSCMPDRPTSSCTGPSATRVSWPLDCARLADDPHRDDLAGAGAE